MEMYMAQKAQQALEELCKDAPLIERLKGARMHLIMVSSENYFASCPADIVEAMQGCLDGNLETDLDSVVMRLRAAIELIFEEAGRQDMRDDSAATE